MRIDTGKVFTIERDGVQYYPQYIFTTTIEANEFLLSEGYEESDLDEFDVIPLQDSLETLVE